MGSIVENISLGTVVKDALIIGKQADGQAISIVYHVIRGEYPGPTIWLNGAIHGDELNGPIALLKLSQLLRPEKMHGTVIITPVSNPLAFTARQKNTPKDLLDLDQQFPGIQEGTISQRLAFWLFKEFGEVADYIIDSHTVGHEFAGKPYTVAKKVSHELTDTFEKSKKLAELFGGMFHCSLDFSDNLSEIPGNVYGFLDVQAQIQGKVAFMVELGSGGLNQPTEVAFALAGYLRVLAHLKLFDSGETEPATLPSIHLSKRYYLYANHAGFLTYTVSVGEFVKKGDLLAEITDLYGNTNSYFASQDVYVIIQRSNAVVETGDRLFFFGESSI